MITRSGLPSYAYPGMITKSGLPSHDYPGSTKRIEIPNELVKPLSLFLFSIGQVLCKVGSTIENMQARSGARMTIWLFLFASPLHLPSGDISTESRAYLVGLKEKFEVAKQFIDQILKDDSGDPGIIFAQELGCAEPIAQKFQMKVPNDKVNIF
ncbi:hypothetical protein GW17_00042776 [Ensete ventricosum]|nr:hypothetical protein GW17_00042776 [Ensete ventricosum]